MYSLAGKVALVTGVAGKNGIGRAIAVRLASEGADIVANDIVERPTADGWGGLPAVVEEIEVLGRRAVAVQADISDAGQVDAMVATAQGAFGHIDILVNNAAAPAGRDRVPVVELEEDAWDLVQRINVKGTFLCSRAVARAMIARGEGAGSSTSRRWPASAERPATPPTARRSSRSAASASRWPSSWPLTGSLSTPSARSWSIPSGSTIWRPRSSPAAPPPRPTVGKWSSGPPATFPSAGSQRRTTSPARQRSSPRQRRTTSRACRSTWTADLIWTEGGA